MTARRPCPVGGHGTLINDEAGEPRFCRVCGYDWLDLEPVTAPAAPPAEPAPADIGAAWFGKFPNKTRPL